MNRLPATSIIVSAVLALTMWMFITWFQQPPMIQMPTAPTPAVTGIVPEVYEVPACDDVEAEMRKLVQNSRGCNENSDCAIFDYGYPIECLTSVAKRSIPSLRREFRRYHASCEYRVYYDCPTGDMQRIAVCRQNRCEIDLVTIDSLQDATLDYLQIN